MSSSESSRTRSICLVCFEVPASRGTNSVITLAQSQPRLIGPTGPRGHLAVHFSQLHFDELWEIAVCSVGQRLRVIMRYEFDELAVKCHQVVAARNAQVEGKTVYAEEFRPELLVHVPQRKVAYLVSQMSTTWISFVLSSALRDSGLMLKISSFAPLKQRFRSSPSAWRRKKKYCHINLIVSSS